MRSCWDSIVDLGSRNGTAVAGVSARPDAPLVAGQPVRLGEVVLGFSLGLAPLPRRRRRATSPCPPLVVTVETDAGTFEFSSAEVRSAAGAVALAPREVELVTALIARRRVHHPELAFVRGAELADSLGFQSIDADDENVRELVLRVRRKLRSIGGDRLIETRRNAGYRLAGALRRA
jgi:DNA-binding winged helix-turn-helix (wHTH) protein